MLHQLLNDVPISSATTGLTQVPRADLTGRCRISKHVPAAMNTHSTIELLLETAFTASSVQNGYKENTANQLVSLKSTCEQTTRRLVWNGRQPRIYYKRIEFCTGHCEDRTWTREAEESPLSEAVAREGLMKTQQAGKSLSWCYGDSLSVEISGGAVIICNSESCVYKRSINPFTNPYAICSTTFESWQYEILCSLIGLQFYV
jgi:hypothetical protein